MSHQAEWRPVDGAAGGWQEFSGSPEVLLSAGHAVEHVRDGAIKAAEAGSADVVRDLAEGFGLSAAIAVGPQRGDPNWDEDSPYVQALWARSPGLLVDLHLMRPRGVDVCLGLGPVQGSVDDVWPIFAAALVSSEFTVSLNWPFSAGPRTVTGKTQLIGRRALQIEINYELLDERKQPLVLALGAACQVFVPGRGLA
jgi:hypothetical protein